MSRKELRRLRKIVWRETKRKAFSRQKWTFFDKIKKIYSVWKLMNYDNKIYREAKRDV